VYVKTLRLEHFRCYEQLSLELGPGLHIMVGPNASGKTTVLEAIGVLALTKSHRCSQDRELVRFKAEWTRAAAEFGRADGRGIGLRVTVRESVRADSGSSRKTFEVNGVPRRRVTEVVGQVPVVMFGPEDLGLVKGPPSGRRRFLNEAISQVRPGYLADLMRYRRGLRQRNECLKRVRKEGSCRELVDAWDGALVESGAAVAGAREEFVRAMAPHSDRAHHRLSNGRERLVIAYKGDLAGMADMAIRRDRLRELLRSGIERDIALGRTAMGPHRDELDILVAERSLRTYGSQGQQRTAALSLVLAQAAVMSQWRDEPPIILLDDCLSELDADRARAMLELSRNAEQMIVTTAAWEPVLDEFAVGARVYDVGDGTVVPRETDS